MKTATQCVHPPRGNDPHGAISPPIYQTATFRQPTATEFGEYDYSRSGNPTRTLLEEQLARLEGGNHAFAFASGMAAITTLTRLLQSGDEILAGDDLYGGTYRLLGKILPRHGITVRYADTSDLEATARAFTPRTILVLIETPTNPLLRITDVQALASLAHDHGARLAVDNSLLSPVLQQPLALGADLVVHSTTKYLNGHSDVVGGAVMMNSDELRARLAFLQNAAGAVPSPMDSFMVLRGTKTLHVRMDRHEQNARTLAAWLDKHPQVERVIYPGLESHPQHALAKKQQRGFGGMISFVLKGNLDSARRFLSTCKLFTLAESLGGVESLIEHPAIMTHASVPPENRKKLGILDGFIRLSVGIEDVADQQADLDRAFHAAK